MNLTSEAASAEALGEGQCAASVAPHVKDVDLTDYHNVLWRLPQKKKNAGTTGQRLLVPLPAHIRQYEVLWRAEVLDLDGAENPSVVVVFMGSMF